jgi:hypothetical protein
MTYFLSGLFAIWLFFVFCLQTKDSLRFTFSGIFLKDGL